MYLEIKNVQRVADDIQKRLYEIAEASIEMKAVYGRLRLRGLNVRSTLRVEANPELRARIRAQITTSAPTVVALFLCSRNEAEIFFQEEIEACLSFLKAAVMKAQQGGVST